MLEFEKMNTIERQSYAEAMNMSEESMADIIKKQEIARKLGLDQSIEANKMYQALRKNNLTHDQAVEKMKEAGAQQYLTASMTEKISAFIDNIKNTLGQMLDGELGQTVNKFISMMGNGKLISEYIEKMRVAFSGVWGFIKELPKTMTHILDIAKIILGVIAAIEIGLGTAMLFNPATALQGAGLIAGGIKMGAAAYGASKLSNVAQDIISVSPAAAQNQASIGRSSGMTSNATSTASPNQPINVNVQNYTLLDGQNIATNTFKNAQSSAPADNGTGQYSTVHNVSFSG
jgi:hypothetical protein